MSYDDVRGEEYEAAKYRPHDDPCDCDVCRRATGATVHRPECPVVHQYPWPQVVCICVALRLCETRVLNAVHEAIDSAWAVDPSWDGTNWNNALTAAKEAIDALRATP